MKINKGWGGMRILAVAIHFSLAAAGMIATGFAAEAQNLISNGDFEITHKMTDVVASEDRGFGSWQVGANRQVPDTWLLNPAYPGTGTVVEEGAYSGRKFLHINSNIAEKTRRGAHLYHPCPAIKAGKCYRVTARIRGGAANIGFYEYHKDAPFRADVVCMGTAAPNEWREISGYYRPVGAGFESAYLAVMIPWGQKVDVDSVSVEEVSTQKVNPAMKPILVENDVMRMELSPLATFEHFVCKETGVDYALPRSICYVNLNGTSMQAQTLSRRGDLVDIRFPDPDVKISLRIKAQDRYFTFEVMDMQPANLSSMTLEFPMKRLATQGIFFSANYDDTFAACAFALNYKAFCLLKDLGKTKDSTTITADFIKEYGIKGGKIALLGTPRKQFGALIQKVERDAGLPSPVLDGKWLRESEPMRRSYLFVTDMQANDIDELIKYAKVGNFQTIVFSKDLWLKTHGHYEINTQFFPGGLEGFKRVTDKIHAAGLKVGVHLFGPSISSNDAYVTPVPDDRLASVQCPPLAESVSATSDTITLTEKPKSLIPQGFPENHLRVGNEIIRFSDIKEGTPFRFTGCTRGAYGTKAVAHAAGSPVRGLITKMEFSMLHPDSTLLDEVASNFAKIVNYCGLDMVYFDASDCEIQAIPMGYDLLRYVEKCHLAFYRKFDHDVLYQTSTGLAFNLLWHIVARGASADGHGDIKAHMDARMNSVTCVKENFDFADVGWYGLNPDIRLDAMEYICAKCLGADGNISVQSSRLVLESHPHAREILEMMGRYERCRVARVFPKSVTDQLLEKENNFKLYEDGKGGWILLKAAYGPERFITKLDGKQNVWTVRNPFGKPCQVALEITRSLDYNHPKAIILEQFGDPAVFGNHYDKYVLGDNKVLTPNVTQELGNTPSDPRSGTLSGIYTATNTGTKNGWCAKGKKFSKPIDLSHSRKMALWLCGDEKKEMFVLQLRDVTGHYYQWEIKVDYLGWRFHTFDIPKESVIDWSKIEYMILYYNDIPPNTSVSCMIAGIKALPMGAEGSTLSNMEMIVNGRSISLPGELGVGQTLSTDSLGTCTLWGGGMKPATRISVPDSIFKLALGDNQLEFKCKLGKGQESADVAVRVICLSPLAETTPKSSN